MKTKITPKDLTAVLDAFEAVGITLEIDDELFRAAETEGGVSPGTGPFIVNSPEMVAQFGYPSLAQAFARAVEEWNYIRLKQAHAKAGRRWATEAKGK